MDQKTILAFSSSRTGTSGYLETALPVLESFFGRRPLQIVFIPFASVSGYEAYGQKVREALSSLGFEISVVNGDNDRNRLEKADVIMVGGGNTFKLLHDLYEQDLLTMIRQRVEAGIPYIGWSAGSNIAGTSIRTTNDMPIAAPHSFEALGFFPFQINPHYQNLVFPGFNGETRDDRLREFLQYNPGEQVVALPEGNALIYNKGIIRYQGPDEGYLLSWNPEKETMDKVSLSDGTVLQFP